MGSFFPPVGAGDCVAACCQLSQFGIRDAATVTHDLRSPFGAAARGGVPLWLGAAAREASKRLRRVGGVGRRGVRIL